MNSIESFQIPAKLEKIFKLSPNERTDSDLSELIHATTEIVFFKKITEERNSDRIHWECCRVMTLEKFDEGQDVIKFGDQGDKFYIILRGRLSVLIPVKSVQSEILPIQKLGNRLTSSKKKVLNPLIFRQKKLDSIENSFSSPVIQNFEQLKVLKSGDSFGELALLDNKPRSATVKCLETSYLAVLSQMDYRKILRSDAEKIARDRVDILKQLPVFSQVTFSSLKCLGYLLSEASYNKNQIVYTENSAVDNIYLVKAGEFKLTTSDKINLKKYDSQSLLKLKLMKETVKKIDFEIVVKGKNQIFGHEEFVLGAEKRKNNCICTSISGKVFVASLIDVKSRPGCAELVRALKATYLDEDLKNSSRLSSLRTVEQMKSSYKKLEVLKGPKGLDLLRSDDRRIESNYLDNGRERYLSDGSVKSCRNLTRAKVVTSEILQPGRGLLKGMLKKGGVGGIFQESFDEIYKISLTSKSKQGRDVVTSLE